MKLFKVRKRGKTRGRRSKAEIILEHIADHVYYRNAKEFEKIIKDAIVNGVGAMKVKWRKS